MLPAFPTQRSHHVANTKSAIKRIRTSEKRRQRHRAVRTHVAHRAQDPRATGRVTTPGDEARAGLCSRRSAPLDKAVTKGSLTANNRAARKKSAWPAVSTPKEASAA